MVKLQGRQISSINSLAGLKNLQTLIICNTRVKDISPLANLKNLTHLDLDNNLIKNISVLANIKNLEYLALANNEINDISALSDLNKLISLNLDSNQISDIAALVNNIQDGILMRIRLLNNNFDTKNSPVMADIQKLVESGVEVKYDSVGPYNYNVEVYVNNELIDFPDQKPFIDGMYSGRTYVPLRFVSEALDARVDWNGAEQKVTINKDNKNITLEIGKKSVEVNGEQMFLDARAILVDNRTMVPLRFIGEILGAEVIWIPGDNGGRVEINSY